MEETIGRRGRPARFVVFYKTTDGGRGTVCRTEFAISKFINLVLSFKIEESVVQIFFNF